MFALDGGVLTGVAVGCGHRTVRYASYGLTHPDEFKIVAVAEPLAERRERFAAEHGIPPERRFETWQRLCAEPRMADVAINGTMDRLHYESTMHLLEAGYHVLLEKPVATSEWEVRDLIRRSRELGRKVVVCHVLRYAPFYAQIKRRLLDGAIGELRAMHTTENVGYAHFGAAFVRGRWRREDESAPILLAKCCHDADLIAWYNSGRSINHVASLGGRYLFRPEKAPPGAGTRCLVDCAIETQCPWSARRNYLDQKLAGTYVWESVERLQNLTDEQRIESLRTDNPFGRCVWHCDNDVADQQSVIVRFDDGAIASHDLFGGVPRGGRSIRLIGTAGEIEGRMETGKFTIRKPSRGDERLYDEDVVETGVKHDMHGGGDMRLVEDFLRVARGGEPSISTADLNASLTGYRIVFEAERARTSNPCAPLRPAASSSI